MGELVAIPINPPAAGTVPSSCAVFLHCIPAPLHVHMTVSGGCTWPRMDTKRGTLGCGYPSWALWGRQGVPGRGERHGCGRDLVRVHGATGGVHPAMGH